MLSTVSKHPLHLHGPLSDLVRRGKVLERVPLAAEVIVLFPGPGAVEDL
jgi:hypothetical protein